MHHFQPLIFRTFEFWLLDVLFGAPLSLVHVDDRLIADTIEVRQVWLVIHLLLSFDFLRHLLEYLEHLLALESSFEPDRPMLLSLILRIEVRSIGLCEFDFIWPVGRRLFLLPGLLV